MTGVAANQGDSNGLTELLDRFQKVRRQVAESALAANREAAEVRVIAVTKGVPLDRVQAASRLGIVDFGENRVQEARGKVPCVEAATWHGIGRLQTNKVNWAVRLFPWIHSVDREDLVRQLSRAAGQFGCRPQVLVEVLTGDAATKGGVVPQRLPWLLEVVAESEHLNLAGLMTVASRDHPQHDFAQLRMLREQWIGRFPSLLELSMGMSDDFPLAIEEGATMIRIGRALFGARPAI